LTGAALAAATLFFFSCRGKMQRVGNFLFSVRVKMIFEGLKLMVIGMAVVMVFLLLMIYCINLVAYLTRAVSARELETIRRDRELLAASRKKAQRAAIDSHLDDDIAVIAAAVAAFEGERMARA
jgi:oxaloacetate decarboxylase (Na+ extruding) subunit gamma